MQKESIIYICRTHIDAMIKDDKDFFRKICTSHFICKVACERELEAEQRLQHIDFPSPSGHSRVSFSFSWAAQPGAWGPASLGHVLIPVSSHQLVWFPKLNRGSQRPLLLNNSVYPTIYLELNRGRDGFIPFRKGIGEKWNANNLVQELNSGRRYQYPTMITVALCMTPIIDWLVDFNGTSTRFGLFLCQKVRQLLFS